MRKWVKSGTATTISEVIERNTGIPLNEFISPPQTYSITNLEAAAEVVRNAISSATPITIYGDYDADGITASSILYLMLAHLLGPEKKSIVSVVLPRRFSEGYGISTKRLDYINEGLLITVDNGISAVDEIRYAKEKGLQVIILDHHMPREDGVLPCADVIVDPHAIAGSDFDGYCGAGLAYKLAELLITDVHLLNHLVGLAAIGTVADVMPLVKDNRNIVIRGLSNMNSGRNCVGLACLLKTLNLRYIDETSIGFSIGPVINAAGRLFDDGAERVFKVLTGSERYAELNANELVEINESRKLIVEAGLETCTQIISNDCLYGENPLVIYTTKEDGESFHEGIVGILAGKLAEKYEVPTFVLCETEDGILKGSARSDGTVDLKALLDSVAEHIYKYGGHAGAAGLSVKKEKISDFIDALHTKIAEFPCSADNEDALYYDLEIAASDVLQVIEELRKFAPFGEGNPQIVFKIGTSRTTARGGKFYQFLGKDMKTLKLFFNGFDAIGFGMADIYTAIGSPMALEMVGTLAKKTFGEYAPITVCQVELRDFVKSKEVRPPNKLSSSIAAKMQAAGMKK